MSYTTSWRLPLKQQNQIGKQNYPAFQVLLVICVSDDIRPIIYVPYVYLVKLIYFIFFLWCYRLWWNKDEYIREHELYLIKKFSIRPSRLNAVRREAGAIVTIFSLDNA